MRVGNDTRIDAVCTGEACLHPSVHLRNAGDGPEPPERPRREPELALDVAVVDEPGVRSANVVELAPDPGTPLRARRAVGSRPSHDGEDVLGVPAGHLRPVGEIGEPLARILANGLQQREGRLVGGVAVGYEALVDG